MKKSQIIINAQFIFNRQHDDDVSFELDKHLIAEELKHSCYADNVVVTSAQVIEGDSYGEEE